MSIKQNLRLLSALLFMSVAFNASAGFDDGLAAAKRGDFKTALSELKPLADQGDALAQDLLGVMYENGGGVAQDYGQAVAWYRKAADQGDADAQSNLGVMYANSRGVARNYIVAYALYNLSASIDSSDKNNATNNRNSLVKHMTPAQVEAGQALTRKMSTRGNLLKALDRYLAHR